MRPLLHLEGWGLSQIKERKHSGLLSVSLSQALLWSGPSKNYAVDKKRRCCTLPRLKLNNSHCYWLLPPLVRGIPDSCFLKKERKKINRELPQSLASGCSCKLLSGVFFVCFFLSSSCWPVGIHTWSHQFLLTLHPLIKIQSCALTDLLPLLSEQGFIGELKIWVLFSPDRNIPGNALK